MPLDMRTFQSLSVDELIEQFDPQELMEFTNGLVPPPQQAVPQPGQAEPEGFFGGITPYDPNEDFFSTKNLGSLASNIPQSALNLGSDVAGAIFSPVETGKALIEAGPSGILGAIGERFGNLKKTAVEDPFGLATDFAPLTAGLGKVAGASRLAKAALNPVRALGEAASVTARKAGTAIGTGAREVAAVASGLDPGVISTARQALAPDLDDLTRSFSRGGEVASDVARTQAEDFAKLSRQSFADSRTSGNVDAIPEAAKRIEAAITQELDDIAETGRANFSNTPVNTDRYLKLLEDLDADMRSSGIDITPRGLDTSGSVIPRDVGAKASIGDALDFAFEPLGASRPTVGDVWMARLRIDAAEVSALAAKAGFSGPEAGIIKRIRGRVSGFLDGINDPAFKKFNQEYAEGAALRERFAREITGTGAAGKTAEAQIAAVIRSIKEGRASSEAFLRRVEARTAIPLRAIAAGTELSDLVGRGLISKGIFAGAVFGGVSGLAPVTLIALLGTSPKFLGVTMRGLGLAERQMQKVKSFVDKIMTIPTVQPLIEQGITIGAIIQQLEREQPTLMGRIGSANNR